MKRLLMGVLLGLGMLLAWASAVALLVLLFKLWFLVFDASLFQFMRVDVLFALHKLL